MMDTYGKILDILFRRIPPERMLRRVCRQSQYIYVDKSPDDYRTTFLRFAEVTLHGYSEDEQALLFARLQQSVKRRAEQLQTQESVFLALVDLGEELLVLQGEEPRCRFSQVLRWREMYHLLGQDMIVCAYLAYRDLRGRPQRKGFAWPAVLRTDNGMLAHLLEEGVAENHFHLNGSTQTFALSWGALMNDPRRAADLSKEFSSLLQSVASRGPLDNVLPVRERLEIAALARSILFRALHREEFFTRKSSAERADETRRPQRGAGKACANQSAACEQSQKDFCSRDEFRMGYLETFSTVHHLTNQIRALQRCYGVAIPLPDGHSVYLDYALERAVFLPVRDAPYRFLAGERYFLYRCFAACFSGEFSEFEQDLFYLYLLLKVAFRGELIQVNRQVGFKNFANYQDRKDLAWQEPYRWEACRMALNAPLAEDHVKTLEARLVPAGTPEEMIRKIRLYDQGKHFGDQPFLPSSAAGGGFLSGHMNHSLQPEPAAKGPQEENYFYVLHFAKRSDIDPSQLPPLSMQCRHQELRQDTKRRALALAEALSRSAYLCSRVRGIDGCSNEVNCRPEVFAPAFRFLRNFQPGEFGRTSVLLSQPIHCLSITYHAGEDFYDIADGLRAIDEAVRFLDYRRGDRIGHALALGVDPQLHYQSKAMNIVLPKQNYLDNLVWLLYRGRDLGVNMDPQQYGILQQEAQRLLRDIYGKAGQDERWSMSLQNYYYSMLLRGDEPELYTSTAFQPPRIYGSQYDRWLLTPKRYGVDLTSYRMDREIAGMYYCYHYGRAEKIEGSKAVSILISPEYITVIRQVQEAMQNYLAQRGIIIECNPTSNVLIGTFGEYSKHPITTFNNIGLEYTENRHRACPQLHVCINTDDLGVFDTSLEFEYALLHRALDVQLDEEGHKRYNGNDILCYLRNIREMGQQAVFPPPSRG